MSSRAYSIIEPHPSVPSSSYIHTGRGGAGNAVQAPSTVTRGSDASGPAARASLSSLSKPRTSFIAGRGGAGNYHNEAPRMFSFDEELQHQMAQEKRVAPVYNVGRGGAGNYRNSRPARHSAAGSSLSRRVSDTKSTSSSSSAESGADVATRNLIKGWKKLTGYGYD